MSEAAKAAKRGAGMDGAAFRAALARHGFNQSSFARMLHENGDPRSVPTILRSVANWARDVFPVPGEVIVIFRLLDRLAERDGAARDAKSRAASRAA